MREFHLKLEEMNSLKVPLRRKQLGDAIAARLLPIIESGAFDSKDIVLFPAARATEISLEILRKNGLSVSTVVDNSLLKQGDEFADLTIQSPDVLVPPRKETIILIFSTFAQEMYEQVCSFGYSEDDCVIIHDLYEDHLLQERQRANDIEYSEALMYLHCKKYIHMINAHRNRDIIFFPEIGLGDAYIPSSYLQDYLGKHKISNYIIMVNSNAQKQIVDLFGFEPIVIMSRAEMLEVVDFWGYMGGAIFNPRIHWLHFRGPRYGLVNEHNLPNNRLTNIDLYKLVGFQSKIKMPRQQMNDIATDAYLSDLFTAENLLPGKTVVLCPFANTLQELPESFWEQIILHLNAIGYTVCTNTAKNEKALRGTVTLQVPFEKINSVVEYAGYSVGVRSGLSDVLSQANAEKILLYGPKSESMYLFSSPRDYDLYPGRLHEFSFDLLSENEIIERIKIIIS